MMMVAVSGDEDSGQVPLHESIGTEEVELE
jgi:hypothetical protein